MIRIDFSRAIPPRLGSYLLPVIPGVFFESSIAAGNPHCAALVIARVREIYPFGPYALLALFFGSSLLIGHGFFIAAWMADLLILSAFALWRFAISITFGSQWCYDFVGKLQGIPPKQNRFIRSLWRVITWARGRKLPVKARPVLKCLHIATKHLLEAGYGIDRTYKGWQSDDGEWGVWYSALGKPLQAFQEASAASRIYLGCGLAGLTAVYVSPALRTLFFIALCTLFTFAGGFSAVDLGLWRIDPVRWSTARLRSILSELSAVRAATEKQKDDSESHPGIAGAASDE